VRKEKEGGQDQPYVSLYRGCRPPRMYEYRLYLYVCDLDVTFFIAGCRASQAGLSKSLRTAY